MNTRTEVERKTRSGPALERSANRIGSNKPLLGKKNRQKQRLRWVSARANCRQDRCPRRDTVAKAAQRSHSVTRFWQSGETCRLVRNRPPTSAFNCCRVWTLRTRLAKRRRPGIPAGSLAGRPTPHRASCLFFFG